MTNNHLLLYRLAELMLKKQQHILPLDDLFEDEQIGAFVRSIQIDSPYQQLIFEGILTETIKKERVMVTFTVEGYFHYVLGEVIEKQTLDEGAEALKQLLENNQLRGITEGVEQCLIRDVERNNLSRLMWLVDEGGKALEASAYTLAQAFLIHSTERVMDELLADFTDNDIEVLKKSIKKLEKNQKNIEVKNIYAEINKSISFETINKAQLYVKSLKYIDKKSRLEKLKKIEEISFDKNENQLKVAVYYFFLAKQFSFISDYDKALVFYEKALKIRLKLNGKNHSQVNRVINAIGATKSYKGEFINALKDYKKVLESKIKTIKKNDSSFSITYNNIGAVYNGIKEYDNAVIYYVKALDIDLKNYGKNHPDVATRYNNIGVAWKNLKKYTEAEEILESALKIRIKTLGEKHLKTATTLNNLGTLLSEIGDYKKSIEYHQKSLSIRLDQLGKYNKSTANSYNNIGTLYRKLKLYNTALINLDYALEIRIKLFGETNQSTATSYNNIASIHYAKKEFEKALEYFEKALEIRYKVLTKDSLTIATTHSNIGATYREIKNYNNAVKSYEKALKIRLKKLGKDDKNYLSTLEKLNQAKDLLKNNQ